MNLNKLKEIINDKKLDALLITSDYNRNWFTNFKSSMGYLIVSKSEATIFLDNRYFTFAKEQIKNANVKLLTKNEFTDFMNEQKFSRIGFEANYMTVLNWQALTKKFTDPTFVPIKSSLFRLIKTDDEIEKITKACQISLTALENIKNMVKPGVSEIEIRNNLEFEMQKNGASEPAFNTIVVSGYRGAFPHGEPSDKILKEGELVTIDFGALYKGYCADITRTFKVGNVKDKKLIEIYNVVKKAQRLGIEAVRPGIQASKIDQICRKYIESKGYGNYFTHSTGHGLGVEVHENPYVSSLSTEILKPNEIITVEPGIYIPGFGGVRFEDDILVTEEGYKILSTR